MEDVLLFSAGVAFGVIAGYLLKKVEILIILRKTVAKYGKKHK